MATLGKACIDDVVYAHTMAELCTVLIGSNCRDDRVLQTPSDREPSAGFADGDTGRLLA